MKIPSEWQVCPKDLKMKMFEGHVKKVKDAAQERIKSFRVRNPYLLGR